MISSKVILMGFWQPQINLESLGRLSLSSRMEGRANMPDLKPTDLRGVLKYVPLWRNHTFVIALDGAVMEEDSLVNLFLEIAVLRNLNINVVLVHGIGAQLEALATERNIAITDARGYGPTDKKTLGLAIELTPGLVSKLFKD
ncbi:MAG: hypothetical protein LR015_07200 [Verrucomicrobia bacterium]|nr:hypothetical protein [Verrucomicrobiota bacterium]